MMNQKFILSCIFSILILTGIQSQQIWPVQVTGSMTPPHSLDLKVYTTDRIEDLMFNVLLMDPLEEILEVRPVLSIEQNGNVIYQTDMNFVTAPLELIQFEPYTLDGSALSVYLSNLALTGNNSEGRGSTTLPEGLLTICIQMYGVERVVPVSNKFCITSNFRLNQPPQIIKPSFNEKIKISPVQNMIFSWQPMHLGSANNPGAVEYKFELVELPQGVMNANDAFESALKVYNTTTTATSLIYSQGEPVLEPNKYYAWRVTASSIMYPTSTLFQNDGRSEISVFVLYDGDSPTSEMNPFDNPAPRGCSVYETSYGSVAKADNESMIVGANQDVKLGYFKMKITEAIGDIQTGYSGVGIVYYPMLRSSLEVEFKNIKVNKEGRVYESEKIQTLQSPDLYVDMGQINSSNVKDFFSVGYVDKLYSKIDNQNRVADLPQDNFKLISLPLVLTNAKYPNDGVGVAGVYFTPKNAFVNLVSRNTQGDIFVGTNIPATPYGLKSGAYLVPLHISANRSGGEKITETILLAGLQSDGSKIECDCNGYQNIKAKTGLIISPQIIHQVDNVAPISLTTEKSVSDIGTYTGKVSLSNTFSVNGLEGFKFIPKSGTLDLNPNAALPGQTSPELSNPAWRGLIIDDMVLELPKKYNIVHPSKPILLERGSLIIDDKDIQEGFFYQKDVLSFSKGRMGPWAYSIDSLMMNISKDRNSNLNLRGQILTPFFDDPFPYRAQFQESKKVNTKLIASILQPELKMSMWHGQFTSKNDSRIEARLVDNNSDLVLSPKCSFTGSLNIKFTDEEFRKAILNKNKSEIIEDFEKSLNLKSLDFNLSNLSIHGLTSDPFNSGKNKYKIDDINRLNTKLNFSQHEDQLKDASFIHEEINGKERLGLKLIVLKGQSKIEMIVWSHKDKSQFEFEGIEIKNIVLKCNCAALNVIPTSEEWDQIIRDYYKKQYIQDDNLLSFSTKAHSGPQRLTENTWRTGISDALKMEEMKANAIAWFPQSGENKIFIPFLGKNLNMENKDGVFQGVYRDKKYAQDKINWDETLFRFLSNEESQDLNLPIVITKAYWDSLGFKTSYPLPDHFKLVISKFKTSAADKLASATMTMDLIGELDVEGSKKYIQFATMEDIAVGPQKIDLADKTFYLLNDLALNQNIRYLSTRNKTSDSKAPASSSTDSYAKINCDKGIEFFNIVGNYTVNSGTLTKANTKTPEAATFGFRMLENTISGNNDLITSFTANLKSEYFDSKDQTWKVWRFSGNNAQHILFSAPDQLDAYLDFNENKSVFENKSAPNLSKPFDKNEEEEDNFIGLVFKNLKFDIPLLEVMKKADGKVETLTDVILKVASFEQLTQSFKSEYSKINAVAKENKATLGTWDYVLDSIAFKFEDNELDENLLLLKGKIRVPIFKQAPSESSAEWLKKYSDSWIPYFLNVGYSTNPEVSGYLSEIEDKLFESYHIDNLGYKLENGSSLEIGSEGTGLMARALLNGRVVYTIPKLDATISTLAFENLKLNYSVENICKGEFLAGINSIDFGTWSPAPFSASQLKTLQEAGKNPSAKDNKYMKQLKGGYNKVANFDINLQEPKFTCNSANDRVLTLGLELNISRDESNFTASQQAAADQNNPEESLDKDVKSTSENFDKANAAYKTQQEFIKKTNSERKELLKLKRQQEVIYKLSNSIPLSRMNADTRKTREEAKSKLDELSKKVNDSKAKFDAAVTEVKKKSSEMKSARKDLKDKKDKLDNVKSIRVAKEDKAKTNLKENLKYKAETAKAEFKNAKDTKTFAITAGGSIDVVFNDKGFKTVDLNCLKLGGSFGPVAFEGGINLFREDTKNPSGIQQASTTKWGNGFLGMVKLKFQKLEFQTKFQTGVKTEITNSPGILDDYRYWFADLAAYNGAGFFTEPNTGIMLTGIGGGFFYNMAKTRPPSLTAPDSSKVPVPKQIDNNKCALDGLEPGKSLSGLSYEVKRKSMGGYLLVELSHVVQVVTGEIVTSLQVSNDSTGMHFDNFGLDVTALALFDSYESRKSAPLVIKSGITVSNDQKEGWAFDGNMKFKFVKEAGPIGLFSPEGASVGLSLNDDENKKWNTILFKLSKNEKYFIAGSWRIDGKSESLGPKSKMFPINASFKTPLINVMAGAYFQIGSKGTVDDLPSLSYLMGSSEFVDKIEKNNPLKKLKSNVSFATMGGLRLNAKFNSSFLIFSTDANGLLGANFRISEVSTTSNKCPDVGKIGFSNGYYAMGNGYADLKLNVKMDANVTLGFCPFCEHLSGSFEILSGQLQAGLNFGFPNPSFLQGEIKADYSLFGGLYKGSRIVPISVGGKICLDITPDPVVGLKIHNKIYPPDGAGKIAFLKKVEITNFLPDNERIKIDPNSMSANSSTQAKYDIYPSATGTDFWLKEKESKKPVKVKSVWSSDKKKLTLEILEELKSKTTYLVTQEYEWRKDNSNAQKVPGILTLDQEIGREKVVTEFTTGDHFDQVIEHELVESSIPARNQRYWYPGYGYPHIRLSANDRKAIEDAFPPNDEQIYVYYIDVVEYTQDGQEIFHRVPTEFIPPNRDYVQYFEQLKDKYINNETKYLSTGGVPPIDFKLLYGPPDDLVTFPEFNRIPFKPGSLCLFQLYRAIADISKVLDLGRMGNFDRNKVDFSIYPRVQSTSNRIIYQFYFGVSQYKSLTDKLNDMDIKMGLSQNSIVNCTREIFLPEKEISEIVDEGIESKELRVPNDIYWGFSGNKEGFDAKDIELINQYMNVTYKPSSINYMNWNAKLIADNFPTIKSGLRKYYNPLNIDIWDTKQLFSTYYTHQNVGDFGLRPNKDGNYILGLGHVAPEFDGEGSQYFKFLPNSKKQEISEISINEISNKKLNSKVIATATNKTDNRVFKYPEEVNDDFDFFLEDGISSTVYLQKRILDKILNSTVQNARISPFDNTLLVSSLPSGQEFIIKDYVKALEKRINSTEYDTGLNTIDRITFCPIDLKLNINSDNKYGYHRFNNKERFYWDWNEKSEGTNIIIDINKFKPYFNSFDLESIKK
jgi:hypothetical protein